MNDLHVEIKDLIMPGIKYQLSRTRLFHSFYGALASSGPWPPLEDASVSSHSSAPLLNLRFPRICDVCLWTTSSRFVLAFAIGLVL